MSSRSPEVSDTPPNDKRTRILITGSVSESTIDITIAVAPHEIVGRREVELTDDGVPVVDSAGAIWVRLRMRVSPGPLTAILAAERAMQSAVLAVRSGSRVQALFVRQAIALGAGALARVEVPA